MDRDMPGPSAQRWRPLLRRADQVTVGVLVTGCFLAILFHWTWHQVIGASLIEIDRAPPLKLEFSVAVNEADWAELTLLPNIGETLARRIVEYRQQYGPFTSLDQLQRVKGIGPKTLRRVEPYVRIEHTGT